MNTLNLPDLKDTIAKLQQLRAFHEAESEKAYKAINALQDVCQHDMKHKTTTPHYRLYECEKCGKQERD